MDFSNLVTILGAGHLFSEHSGMDGKRLRRVGPMQYAAHFVVDGKISVDADKCLGCGLCVSTCAGKARAMAERSGYGRDRQVPAEILLGRPASAGPA